MRGGKGWRRGEGNGEREVEKEDIEREGVSEKLSELQHLCVHLQLYMPELGVYAYTCLSG